MSNVVPFADAPHGMSQRLPPTNVQAEQGLLGSLLANSAKAYPLVADFLRPEHFADPVNGRIFRVIARRAESNQVADAVTLRAEFENSGELVEVGGAGYLQPRGLDGVDVAHARVWPRGA
jgi:replicative DNA helicase